MPASEKVRRFYLAAREIRYDPDLDYSDPEIYRASSVLQAGNAYCVGKAALFAALCRASGIPARVAFADVTNHLSSEKLRESRWAQIISRGTASPKCFSTAVGSRRAHLQFDSVQPFRRRAARVRRWHGRAASGL